MPDTTTTPAGERHGPLLAMFTLGHMANLAKQPMRFDSSVVKSS